MSDTLLPCLKPRDWHGREHTICRTLWPHKPSQFMPWLAIGFDHPHTFQFLNSETLKPLGMSETEAEAKALDNMRKRPATWQPVDSALDDGKTLKMLICLDDFFATERILDPDFMKDAQRQLRAERILVGIPRRGVLMASPMVEDDAIATAFGAVVATQSTSGESAAVSPMLFVVADGEIIGFSESVAEALADKPKADEAAEDPNAPYISVMSVRDADGKLELHIVGGGEDGDSLVRGFENAFHQVLRKYNDDPEFSRKVKILVFGYTPAAAQQGLPQMLAHLRGIVSDMQGHGMPPITIEMEIQKDSPFGSAATSSPPSVMTTSAATRTSAAWSAALVLKRAFQIGIASIIAYGVWEKISAP